MGLTVNAAEMIDLRNIVHRKSIHSVADPEISDKKGEGNVSRAQATLRYLPPPLNQMNDSAQKVNFAKNTIPTNILPGRLLLG